MPPKRKEVSVELRFTPWLVWGTALALAVVITTIVLQTQKPYVHRARTRPDTNADSLAVAAKPREPQAAPACRVHFTTRNGTQALVFHGVVERESGDDLRAFSVPMAGLLQRGSFVRNDTSVDLAALIEHVHTSLCSDSKHSNTTCYAESMFSDDSTIKEVSMNFLLFNGVSLLVYGASSAFFLLVFAQVRTSKD